MAIEALNRRKIPAGARLSVWTAPDGWEHRRLDWPQPEGTRARGSVLFAGGRADFIEKYLEPLHHWHSRGWNVTAFDWRSQGGSRGDIMGGHLDSLDPLVDDLAALMEQWRIAGPGPHVAVAHSMGGHVLLRTLAERAPRLEAAVLVAPMLMINSGAMPPFAAASLAAAAGLFGLARQPAWQPPREPAPAGSFRQRCLTGCEERYEDELWWLQKEPGFHLGAPTWGWLRAAYASCEALTPQALTRVKVPVLIVATEADRLVSAAAIRRAAETLPDAELMMFERAAHEILRETDEVRLAALARIDAFFDRRAPR